MELRGQVQQIRRPPALQQPPEHVAAQPRRVGRRALLRRLRGHVGVQPRQRGGGGGGLAGGGRHVRQGLAGVEKVGVAVMGAAEGLHLPVVVVKG